MEEKKTVENLKDLLEVMEAEDKAKEPVAIATVAAPPTIPEISFDDFIKADIRVGDIVSAERIPKKDRLLRLNVSLGELGMRTIVAGIAESYEPEMLVAPRRITGESLFTQKILVVTNLAPRMVGGVMSHGMLLAGKDVNGKLSLATCPNMPAGTQIG